MAFEEGLPLNTIRPGALIGITPANSLQHPRPHGLNSHRLELSESFSEGFSYQVPARRHREIRIACVEFYRSVVESYGNSCLECCLHDSGYVPVDGFGRKTVKDTAATDSCI